jgi:hypothetical protein
MDEMSAVCLNCQMTTTLPMPDGFETPDGTMIPAADMDPETVAAYLWGYMQALPCPACGRTQLQVLSEEGGESN